MSTVGIGERKVNGLRTFFSEFCCSTKPKPKTNSFMKHFFTLIAAAMTFMVSGWSQGTVLDVIATSPDHTLLAAAVNAAELNDALSGPGPLTVFAPTDDAINNGVGILNITVEELLALPNLAGILTYHVVGDSIGSGDLTEGGTATTLFGADLTFSTTGGAMVEYANIGPADLPASNGVVHVIDNVLLTFGCTDADACNYDPFAIRNQANDYFTVSNWLRS